MEEELLRRLLARRILMQLIGGANPLPDAAVSAGVRTVAGRPPAPAVQTAPSPVEREGIRALASTATPGMSGNLLMPNADGNPGGVRVEEAVRNELRNDEAFTNRQPARAFVARKKGATGSKQRAQDAAGRTGAAVEQHPPERVRRNLPVTPGSGVRRIQHTSRPLTLAEIFTHLGR